MWYASLTPAVRHNGAPVEQKTAGVSLRRFTSYEKNGRNLSPERTRFERLHLNFIGNVEGRDIYNGRADVIVCDGFTGNVALKTSEGLIEAVLKLLKDELSRNLQAKLGALLSQQSFKRLKKRWTFRIRGTLSASGRDHLRKIQQCDQTQSDRANLPKTRSTPRLRRSQSNRSKRKNA
jgi:hypothetical protein